MEAHAADLEALKGLLLDMAQERTLESVLQLATRRLAERPDTALARIWLRAPGDICEECPMLSECSDQSECLHLVASCGHSVVNDEEWSNLHGSFRRIPVGVRKVGHIAVTGEGVHVEKIDADSKWIARPDWADSEGIRGLAGQPLIHGGEVLGVLAVFSRQPTSRARFEWLRLVADHAATAIANARAFEEIERLHSKLALENEYLREEISHASSFGDIVGCSAAMENVVEQAELVAPTDASVLILGESGTGKELVAREIHNRSKRRDRPMVKVNCASIPRDLYESEFFGHVQGAFTGAVADRAGRFELADGGTLFLDEVGEIPPELQSKLLRVLQEGTYERIGDERTRTADVRIVAATNRHLKEEVEAGKFRQDLYYRLNVFPIEVAPLRERKEDIPLLASWFTEQAARKFNCAGPRLTQAAVLKLQQYDWPGNVRELQNVVERSVITNRCGTLQFDVPESNEVAVAPPEDAVLPDSEIRRIERDNLRRALEQTDWKIYGDDGAAALLGVKPTTLSSRIKKLDLQRR